MLRGKGEVTGSYSDILCQVVPRRVGPARRKQTREVTVVQIDVFVLSRVWVTTGIISKYNGTVESTYKAGAELAGWNSSLVGSGQPE